MRLRTGMGILLAGLVFCGPARPLAAGVEKPKPEDVVAKHLESLGPAERRASTKSRVAEGTSHLQVIVGGTGEAWGTSFLLSEERKLRIGTPTETYDYWGEQFGFDGNKAEVAFVQPSRRSQLGSFLRQYDQIIREGLVGGALTTAWALLDLPGRQPRLRYDGIKKLEGKELHRLSYVMKKGQGEVEIYLYFEPETFRHVRTSYSVTRSSPLGPDITQSSQQQETRYSLEEFYSDFKEVDGLTLPTQWKLRQTQQVAQRVVVVEVTVNLSRITHNRTLEAKDFVVEQRNK